MMWDDSSPWFWWGIALAIIVMIGVGELIYRKRRLPAGSRINDTDAARAHGARRGSLLEKIKHADQAMKELNGPVSGAIIVGSTVIFLMVSVVFGLWLLSQIEIGP